MNSLITDGISAKESLNEGIETIGMQQLLDAFQIGVIVVNRESSIVFSNKISECMLGYSRKNLRHEFFSTLHPEAWKECRKIFRTQESKKGQKHQIGENNFFVSQWPVLKENSVLGVIIVLQDYSTFEENIFQLDTYQQLAKELDIIFQSTYDGLYIANGNGITLRVNKSWEKITGLSQDDVLGKNTADLPELGYVSKCVTPSVIKKKRPISLKATTMTNRQVLVSGNPVFDEKGNVEMVVSTVRDLTDIERMGKELKLAQEQNMEYQDKLANLQQQLIQEEDSIIESVAMKEILDLSLQISDVSAHVLITGETGVGKEVIAKLIHKQNNVRAHGPFLKINCGAIPDGLLEAELFGYERGAFTSADPKGKPGLLELANGGTIVLDEIGELPYNVQSKLLNVLQDSKITRVGGVKSYAIDVQFICLTNRNLNKMVKDGNFREDLYYRMNVVPIEVPPLRKRRDDIIPLINHFVHKFTKKYNRKIHFTQEAIDYLYYYDWPGNVRELSHFIERSVVVHKGETIDSKDLSPDINTEIFANLFNKSSTLKEAIKDFEYEFITEAIHRYGNIKNAAEKIGVDQSTLYRKLKQRDCHHQ